MIRYYLDTSIWLDSLEERDEPGFPKTSLAHELVKYIVKNGHAILISDLVLEELNNSGYHEWDVDLLFYSLREVLKFIETCKDQIRRAKDLAAKRSYLWAMRYTHSSHEIDD